MICELTRHFRPFRPFRLLFPLLRVVVCLINFINTFLFCILFAITFKLRTSLQDPEYTNSYQFAWPSLLVAGFPIDHACAEQLPCIEQTAAEFCMKYGPCPHGASYRWEQTLCDVPHSNSSTPSKFQSFTVFELFHGADAGREERGLATRRMHAKLAPQVTENPIYMHW